MNSASQSTTPGGSGVFTSDSFQGSYPVQPTWSDARFQTARFTLGKNRKSMCEPTVDSLPPQRGQGFALPHPASDTPHTAPKNHRRPQVPPLGAACTVSPL